MNRRLLFLAVIAAALAAVLLLAREARAHCDGMDGPVVLAARSALESGDVSRALIWVRPQDEEETRTAFEQTLAVRRLSPQARELADRHFFETLVRIHRAGEGAPYTGLKPAGRDLGPAIPAADGALATGDIEPLVKLVTDAAARGLRERFAHARALQAHDPRDVQAGREYVEAYISFVHYAESCYRATQPPAHGHAPEPHTADGHVEGQ
jgi:hypothetical protein